MLDISFLSGIELFKHLPDFCLEALEKGSNIVNCSAGHLFFRPGQTGRVEKEVDEHSGRDVGFYPSTLNATLLVTIENPVAGLARNTELPAKLRHRLASWPASYKLQPFIHHRTLLPWHHFLPQKKERV